MSTKLPEQEAPTLDANGSTVTRLQDGLEHDFTSPRQDPDEAVELEKQAESSAKLYANVVHEEDYSAFTIGQKRLIIAIGSFTAWLSPMSGSIYYPALNSIAADLHVTSSKVNLTVTTYLIIQGLAPMMIAGFSDAAGRRPAYFICFSIYIVANLGLALENDYVALLILRMVQSGGSSGTVALAQGMVGDCVTSSERGKYIAYASSGPLALYLARQYRQFLEESLVIGKELIEYGRIFWFLLILSVATFIPLALFLPETCRKIVGDGSIPPPWPCVNLSDTWRHKKRAEEGIEVDEVKKAVLRKNFKIAVPNPIGTLKVLADFESALILLATAFAVSCFYAISTGASVAFSTLYGFDDLYVSLMFLPIGTGGYRRHAKKLNFPVLKNRQTDLSNFPIEQARLQIALPMFGLAATSIIGYGWMLSHKLSLAGPIIMLFILGYSLIAASQVLNVLIIDIYPGQPATATAANNVSRCLLGAAATAAIGPMVKAMGNGWSYTVLALLFVASCAGPVATMRYGIVWRRARKAKEERRKGDRGVVDG
ncbi:hypothetical protein LTR62_000823 [Meristemomyces frigidus]|uniref:Major facilitator superfamily (MFS) profile domain-containing protein n=1 Tax=Meristemomyces frigidus TaxID=1508187 RepID=A0AAN7TP31_9PEZI|nr:hypothetical protein LTR62_000823 [Meristemomyces frigidus]